MAAALLLIASNLSGAMVRADPLGAVNGQVTGPGGAPVQDVKVTTCPSTTPGDSRCRTTETWPDGRYSIATPVLGLGEVWWVSFENDVGLPSGYWTTTGFAPLDDGSRVNPDSAANDIDVELPAGISISGRVTDAAGTPVPGMVMDATPLPATGGLRTRGVTAADGTYSLGVGVSPGDYTIHVDDPRLPSELASIRYPDGYYSSSGFTLDDPTPVAVSGAPVADIDIEFPPVPGEPLMDGIPVFDVDRSIETSWTYVSGGADVTSYDIRVRRAPYNGNFGSWVIWKTGVTGSTATYPAKAGSTYCFSVRARDDAGLVSLWSLSSCAATPLDDRRLSRQGPWKAKTGAPYYADTILRSATKGASVSLYTKTIRVAFLARTCPTCGTVKVYWGPHLLGTVSLVSSTPEASRLFELRRMRTTHTGTVRIVVSSPSGRSVGIDAILLSRV